MSKYNIQRVNDGDGSHFRIADEHDNRVATCFTRNNACLVHDALNGVGEFAEVCLELLDIISDDLTHERQSDHAETISRARHLIRHAGLRTD